MQVLVCGDCDTELGEVELPNKPWLDPDELLEVAMGQMGITCCTACLSSMLVVVNTEE